MVTFFRFTLVGKLGRTASIMFIVSFAIRQLIAEESNQTFIRHDDARLLPTETNAP